MTEVTMSRTEELKLFVYLKKNLKISIEKYNAGELGIQIKLFITNPDGEDIIISQDYV